jgi:Bifunctional DNA primase/polymerase, N-terminal
MKQPSSIPMTQVAAIALAHAGYRVFPCRGKLPMAARGCHDGTSDRGRVEAWWRRWPTANVAVATGNGLAVVDVDGSEGFDSLVQLIDKHAPGGASPEVFATARVQTGGGGWHLWFRTPAGVEIRNSAGRLGAGLDVRGDGGYVVVPPSQHPNGSHYQWDGPRPIAPMPAWLLALARKPHLVAVTAPVERQSLRPGEGGSRYGLAALASETAAVRTAPEGTRNHRLNVAGFALGQLVAGGELEETLVAEELEAAALAAGLPQNEVAATLRSGLTAGKQRPRTAAALRAVR